MERKLCYLTLWTLQTILIVFLRLGMVVEKLTVNGTMIQVIKNGCKDHKKRKFIVASRVLYWSKGRYFANSMEDLQINKIRLLNNEILLK